MTFLAKSDQGASFFLNFFGNFFEKLLLGKVPYQERSLSRKSLLTNQSSSFTELFYRPPVGKERQRNTVWTPQAINGYDYYYHD
jgi:hypothetical protein